MQHEKEKKKRRKEFEQTRENYEVNEFMEEIKCRVTFKIHTV